MKPRPPRLSLASPSEETPPRLSEARGERRARAPDEQHEVDAGVRERRRDAAVVLGALGLLVARRAAVRGPPRGREVHARDAARARLLEDARVRLLGLFPRDTRDDERERARGASFSSEREGKRSASGEREGRKTRARARRARARSRYLSSLSPCSR